MSPDSPSGHASAAHVALERVRRAMRARIVGQSNLVDLLLVALVSDGHVLIEGMPGLAKTTAVKALAYALEGDFRRIQFTPDLLPSDLVGTDIYRQTSGTFEFRPGPLFHNVILADEVNRAPAKVQSALLEAMAERQVTVGQRSYALPAFFMVLATQNPIEQEGTYRLPEAQLDRFLLHIWVDYPNRDEELAILALDEAQHGRDAPTAQPVVLDQQTLFNARHEASELYMDQRLGGYAVDLVMATRGAHAYDRELARWTRIGASPRATIALVRCARALAWLHGEGFVSPEHIQAVAPAVLRHRAALSFEAEADGITSDDYIHRLLQVVAIP